ncbi:cytochrome P450 [Crossiella sp. CA-258035]|uniref:cytochrome P450 n=1 Tax=Crossiella sp. CA-258035 TaxID=2981138 RepID=UPI0024BCABFC|nr:cytochrome P450 [Crossiella sp. CA-258035]WHT23138.1 cytochrome P450 [Crossiella sp. CA-258035]
MTEVATPVPALPTERPAGCPFDPPAELGRLRERQPLTRLVFGDGHLGWLATSHRLVRAVLADSRFSSRYEIMHAPIARVAGSGAFPPAPPGDFIGMDAPEHTRYRRLLTGKFTVRRMHLLTQRVEQLAAEHLDAMELAGGPLDLVAAYAQPIPALMICELLGVPAEGRHVFRQHSETLNNPAATEAEQATAMGELGAILHGLVLAKRANPTDDLLSDLTSTDLTDEELTRIGGLLLGAGLDTTANMIGLGVFALLRHPEQLAALRADPASADRSVEELLRYLTIVSTNVRTALEDIELDGQLVEAGESVALAMDAANRDPQVYPDPDRLDLSRSAGAHLALGHGIHQCLGQQLARVELRVAIPALVTRFPTLRLAVPAEEVPLRTGLDIYGVHRLPVTW